MKNWAGQEIEVGSIVWRGARDGNTSSFKIGRVVEMREGNRPRVNWLYEKGGYYSNGGRAGEINTSGSPDINSLALIDPATLGVKL